MKTKILKRLLITFSFLFIAGFSIVWACSGDDSQWFGYSDFAPEPFIDSTYKPLLYSPYEMFYGINYEDKHISRFNDEILTDWTVYLKNSMNESRIRFLLLDNDNKIDIEGLFDYISNKTKNAAYNQWDSQINLNDPKIVAFIEFLNLAKKIEQSTVNSIDYWNYDNAVLDSNVKPDLILEAEKKYQNTQDKFLQNRYWFQTLKAYFYSDTRKSVISFFEKTKNEFPKNTLYYRALSYVAGAEYQAGNFSRSNYLNSIVFDKCPSLRTVAAYDFHPQNQTDWNQSLNLAQNNNEKAALWALLGYYVDEIRAIDEIYKLNPKSEHLNYLLTRAVNKEEKKLHEIELTSPTIYKNDLKKILDANTLKIINTIALSEKTEKPYLWNLAVGYLQTLNADYVAARQFFDKSEKQIGTNEIYKQQLRLLRFVNTLSEITEMNANNETKILSDLNWIYFDAHKTAAEGFRYEKALSWSHTYISALYAAQNNAVFAELFKPANDFYQDLKKLEAMKTFLSKNSKSAYEKMAASIYPIDLNDIYAYQAVGATYANKINDALAFMAKADGIKDVLLKGNPFNGNIQDCHDCDHVTVQKTKYSKYRLIEIIQIMQNKVKNGEELYNNYLLLGNAFYNISHFGNARFFYEGKIIGTDYYSAWDIAGEYKNMLTDMSLAKKYYQNAYDVAATNEQKAKCAYMLAKCERNEFYNESIYSQSEWDYSNNVDFKAWKGFKLLSTLYSDTKYYQEVIRECDYFSKYSQN